MAPIKVGIVGYGFGARNFHVPFIKSIPALEIVAFFQRAEAPSDPTSAPPGSHCTVDFPDIKHYRKEEEFFADPDIQLVVVVTRTDTHAFFAEKALLAGKHAIADKPFAKSAAEADRVIKVAESKGLILTCYQNRRWDGDFRTLRSLIQKDALGEIKEAEIHYDFESPPWLFRPVTEPVPPENGMGFGLGSHSVDQALVLFGRPKSVTGFFRTQIDNGSNVEDSFTIILQYDGPQKDLLVTVKTSVTTPLKEQIKYIIRGTKGSYVKTQQRSTCVQEEQIAKGVKPRDPGFGVEPESVHGILTTIKPFDTEHQVLDEPSGKYSGRYPSFPGYWVGLYENVADAINGKAELEVKPTQSRDALRTIELARESHEKGITVLWH